MGKRGSSLSVVIATHVYATGPAQDLKQFLINEKINRLLFLTHPLWLEPHLKGSGYEYYEHGQLQQQVHSPLRKLPTLITYLKDAILNVFFVIRQGRGWDLYIGCNNLNAFSGLVLRRLGIVKKTVYYTIDYNPTRFRNKVLNYIYHWIDQWCTAHADETWNTTHLVEEARAKYFGFHKGKQKIVPIGIWFNRFPRVPFSEINKHTAVFMGNLRKRQGVQDIISAIPFVVNTIPDFQLLIIGGGDYAPQLAQQIKDLGVAKHVTFTGYIEKHEDIEKMLVRCALAIVMYQRYDEKGNLNFVYFGDPGKIKPYLASGLPIIMNDFAFNARTLEKAGCAVIVDNTASSIASAIITLLSNEQTLQYRREQAVKNAQQFDWPTIFSENITRVLEC